MSFVNDLLFKGTKKLSLSIKVYHSNGGKYGMMEHLVDNDKYISKNFKK